MKKLILNALLASLAAMSLNSFAAQDCVDCQAASNIQEFVTSDVEDVANEIEPIQNELVMAAKACNQTLMSALIEQGADINKLSYDDAGAKTYPIFKAVKNCSAEFVVKIIKDFSINTNVKRPINDTPLLLPAIRWGAAGVAVALIKNKLIDINALNANDKSALHVAASFNNLEVIDALFASTDPIYNVNTHKVLNKFRNPLRIASDNSETLDKVLNHPSHIAPFKPVYIYKTLQRMDERFNLKIREARDAGNEQEAVELEQEKSIEIKKVTDYLDKHYS